MKRSSEAASSAPSACWVQHATRVGRLFTTCLFSMVGGESTRAVETCAVGSAAIRTKQASPCLLKHLTYMTIHVFAECPDAGSETSACIGGSQRPCKEYMTGPREIRHLELNSMCNPLFQMATRSFKLCVTPTPYGHSLQAVQRIRRPALLRRLGFFLQGLR